MSKRPIPTEEEISKIQVRLPRVFGMEPVKYIVPLYIFMILALLFGLILVPGLANPGSHYRIESNVQGAAVYLDDKRLGSVPLDSFIPAGTHDLSIRSPFFKNHGEKINVALSPFGTLFGWGRQVIGSELRVIDLDAYLADRIQEFSRWSLAPADAKDYQVPAILAPLAHNLRGQSGDGSSVARALQAAIAHVGTPSMAKDWLEAWNIAFGTEKDQVRDGIIARSGILGDPLLGPQFPDTSKALGSQTAKIPPVSLTEATGLVLGNRSYSGFALGGDAFYIDNQEVDEALFSRFLEAHPEWGPEARNALLDQGLADKNYLLEYELKTSHGSQAMGELSLAASEAFLAWYQEALPESMKKQGYKARLPSRDLWLAVNDYLSAKAGKYFGSGPWLVQGQALETAYLQESGTLRHWHGGMFEYSSSSASLFESTSPEDSQARQRFPGFQNYLLGGSLSMDASVFKPEAKFALPRDWTSPVTGLRIWLVK